MKKNLSSMVMIFCAIGYAGCMQFPEGSKSVRWLSGDGTDMADYLRKDEGCRREKNVHKKAKTGCFGCCSQKEKKPKDIKITKVTKVVKMQVFWRVNGSSTVMFTYDDGVDFFHTDNYNSFNIPAPEGSKGNSFTFEAGDVFFFKKEEAKFIELEQPKLCFKFCKGATLSFVGKEFTVQKDVECRTTKEFRALLLALLVTPFPDSSTEVPAQE